jgi:hypothetical protein
MRWSSFRTSWCICFCECDRNNCKPSRSASRLLGFLRKAGGDGWNVLHFYSSMLLRDQLVDLNKVLGKPLDVHKHKERATNVEAPAVLTTALIRLSRAPAETV